MIIMPPAATIGVQTNHGSPLGPLPGSPNVFINNKPAFRTGSDFHFCPLFSGNTPHRGGTVLGGSGTVFINQLPATRQGDTILEGVFENKIASGSNNVNIGG